MSRPARSVATSFVRRLASRAGHPTRPCRAPVHFPSGSWRPRQTGTTACLIGGVTKDYTDVVSELTRIRERLRTIRDRHCEPKSIANPRYLALSNAVSGLNKAIADMKEERDR